MGTWIKETDKAIYLMDDNYYIDVIFKRPSTTNPKEQVANITTLRSWFAREDKPRRMTVSVGTGAPEPEPMPSQPAPPPPPSGGGSPAPHNGMQIRVSSNTFFKQSTKSASTLPDREKVFVRADTVFNIEYYTDVGNHHWQIELLEPTLGDQRTTSWYVFTPHIELLTGVSLKVVSDTLFKLEPKLSIDLPESAKIFVKNGTRFTLISFEPAAGNHTKLELADAVLGPNDDKIWYAFTPDIEIQGQRQTLQVTSDTLLKTRPVQSSELPPAEKVFVKNKTVFLVNSYAQPENLHVRVALQGAGLGPQNRNTWYCFVPDITISGTEWGNQPDDSNASSGQPANPSDRGIPLRFPGFDGTYYANDPIYWETKYGERGNFTWGEAVHADPESGFYRRPASTDVVYGILRVAAVMEDIRKRYGDKPIQINSWYRDPATNAAIGGASQSRHLVGDAVDFVVPGVHPYDVFANLDRWWGSRGGLASSTVFTHIDVRGYRARWDYGY
jgi:hypothetical protein